MAVSGAIPADWPHLVLQLGIAPPLRSPRAPAWSATSSASRNKGPMFPIPSGKSRIVMLSVPRPRPILCLAAVVWIAGIGFGPDVPAQSGRRSDRSQNALRLLQDQHRELHGKFSDELERIARFCDENNFSDAAAEIRKIISPVNIQVLRIDSLPRQVQPELPVALPAEERQWRTQLWFHRSEYAKDLYLLSRRVLNAGFPSYAYDLVREVALHDPDHRAARRLLGYERYGDEWVTPFAAHMLKRHYVWHDDFGWLPASHVERYEQGERYFKRRWLSAAKEAEIRRDFRNAWEIRTDHYLVKTNHSLERGIELAKALEDFHQFFLQTFAGFFNTPEQMQVLFEGPLSHSRRSSLPRPYVVHYYRERAEYVQKLQRKYPQIGITNGLYDNDDGIVYFFHNPDEDTESTLFHEATHQLFSDGKRRNWTVGETGDFWIIEGIACYMESFERNGGQNLLGDPEYVRFAVARYRYLNDRYYIPLKEFAEMGMVAFQSHPKIANNYSQAASLAHFFMHFDGGRYRDALVEHLSQLYTVSPRSRSGVQSLAEITGVGFEELDRQYGEYLKQLNEDYPLKFRPVD